MKKEWSQGIVGGIQYMIIAQQFFSNRSMKYKRSHKKMLCILTLFYWLGFPFVFLCPRGDKWSNISGVDQKFSITNGNLKKHAEQNVLFCHKSFCKYVTYLTCLNMQTADQNVGTKD